MNEAAGKMGELGEPAVKKLVHEWLVHEGYIVFPEFEVEGGRLDFLGVRWLDEGRRLDVVGVECKGAPNAGDVWRITSEQLHRYARCVPRLYFACSVPSLEARDAFRALCKPAQVGFLCAEGAVLQQVDHPPEIGSRFQPAAYIEQVRARVILRLAFRAVFAQAPGQLFREGSTWISTPEKNHEVQWNAVIDSDRRAVYLGVNIENAKQVFSVADAGTLTAVLSGLPADAVIWAGQDRYFGPGRRATLPLIETYANSVTVDEIAYLAGLAASKGLPVHLTVGLPLWTHTETRHRAWYEDAMRARSGVLAPVYAALSS